MYSYAHLTSFDKFHQVGRHGWWPSWSLFVAVMFCDRHCRTPTHLRTLPICASQLYQLEADRGCVLPSAATWSLIQRPYTLALGHSL